MRQRTLSIFFTLIFFALLAAAPVYWLLRGENLQSYSRIEGRNLQVFPALQFRDFTHASHRLLQGHWQEARSIFFNQFLERGYQVNFEKAVTEQFPLRLRLIRLARLWDKLLIRAAYLPLQDEALPTNRKAGYYVLRNEPVLLPPVTIYDENLAGVIDERAANYAELGRLYPEINFYTFFIDTIFNSAYHPASLFFHNADRGRAYAYFLQQKPLELASGELRLSNAEDYRVNFYRTDHHLNYDGVIAAYHGIHQLLARGFEDISPPVVFGEPIVFDDIRFLGSFFRRTLYFLEGDEFKVINPELADFTIYENGKPTDYNQQKDYMAGDYPRSDYINHYAEYYGYDSALLEYEFENGSERNLLVVANSFTAPLRPLIASHYAHTWYVDLRHFEDFSLSAFLEAHRVDDVLFVGDGPVIYADEGWRVNP